MKINFVFTDLDRSFVLSLDNSVLNYREAPPAADADVTLRLTRDLWLRLVTGQAGLRDLIFSDDLEVDGSRLTLLSFFGMIPAPDASFAIIEP